MATLEMEIAKGLGKSSNNKIKKIPKTTTIIYSQKFKATSLSFMQIHPFFPSSFTGATHPWPALFLCLYLLGCFFKAAHSMLMCCARVCVRGVCMYQATHSPARIKVLRPYFQHTRPTPERYLPCCVVCVIACVCVWESE